MINLSKQKQKPEILAPVGGSEQLIAALRSGADAVYFGMKNFNARRNADNFADESLDDVISLCHVRGVKVNITLNTLVTDDELDQMKDAVAAAVRAGADAIITQDLAVASYIKKTVNGVRLHASTQMACHNSEGVKRLLDLGFDRIVLARELSLKEISEIIEKTGAECEVFVHGAHCMSVSGNCYLSSMIGGRSGNRGLCAQPCRLDWKCGNSNYILSLKDLSYITHMHDLADIGVRSLKIEGRMKRAEYVAAAVSACIDAREGKDPDLETLRAVFSRSGFSDGYLTGKRDETMFGIRTKDDVTAAKKVLDSLAAGYNKEIPRVSVKGKLVARKDANAVFSVTDGEKQVCYSGEKVQIALNRPLTQDYAKIQLSKTGGTPFYFSEIQCDIDEGVNLNAAQLNALRRGALDLISRERSVIPGMINGNVHFERKGHSICSVPETWVRFEKAAQIPDDFSGDRVILPIKEVMKKQEMITSFQEKLIAEVPDILWETSLERMRATLKELYGTGLRHVMCGNIGSIALSQEVGYSVHGGPCLNLTNSESISSYAEQGLADLLVSFELPFEKIRMIVSPVPIGIIIYGYLPLMKFRSCPVRASVGCSSCGGNSRITDRIGEKFTVLCRDGEYSEMLNCVPLYVADKHLPQMDYHLISFTTESKEECCKVLDFCRQKLSPDFRRTGGLYLRDLL